MMNDQEKPLNTDSASCENGTTALHATTYHGVDTTVIGSAVDEIYERKVAILNQALIDIGMGPFQWKIVAMTGFGWFVDNVRLPLVI